MTITILSDDGSADVPAARTDGTGLWLKAHDIERATGWALKPEGLCRGDVCLPVPPEARAAHLRDGEADVAALWRRMGRAVVESERRDIWVLGEAAGDRIAAMESLEAPDFALPGLDGRVHRLSDHRGEKVLLTTWASW